jgi:hypothetical protein
MCYIPSNADRSDLRFLFVIYESTACILVECTQNEFYIIQRRSTRRAFSFVIYHSTACSGVECTQNFYPKCIKYHPTPIGATRAFLLIYQLTACI